jgi:hypothetical protein
LTREKSKKIVVKAIYIINLHARMRPAPAKDENYEFPHPSVPSDA